SGHRMTSQRSAMASIAGFGNRRVTRTGQRSGLIPRVTLRQRERWVKQAGGRGRRRSVKYARVSRGGGRTNEAMAHACAVAAADPERRGVPEPSDWRRRIPEDREADHHGAGERAVARDDP